MRKLGLVIFGWVLAVIAHAADGWTDAALTPGVGRLEVVTDLGLFSYSTDHEARIPARIADGARIAVEYLDDRRWKRRSFDVVAISTKGDLCRLHSRPRPRYGGAPGDTIYVKGCSYTPQQRH